MVSAGRPRPDPHAYCQHKDKDGEDLGKVMDLRLIIINTRSVPMVLDHVRDKSRHSIQGLECVMINHYSVRISGSYSRWIPRNPEKRGKTSLRP